MVKTAELMWLLAKNQGAITKYIFHYKQVDIKLLGTVGLFDPSRYLVISNDF